mgnify:CR=1 FL=1
MATLDEIKAGLATIQTDLAGQKTAIEAAVGQLNQQVLDLRAQLDQGVITAADLDDLLGTINAIRAQIAGLTEP